MAYPTITKPRRLWHLDGSQLYYNLSSWASAWTTVSAANEQTLNGLNAYSISYLNQTLYMFLLFPELIDLAYFVGRYVPQNNSGNLSGSVQTSPDTTNGSDGTWTNVTFVSGNGFTSNTAADWYRSPFTVGPVSGVLTPIVGIKAVRFAMNEFGGGIASTYSNLHIYGDKSSGQTPDDLMFYSDSGATTLIEGPYDWGDIPVGSSQTHTVYMKNTSATKTASSVALSLGDSNSADFTLSIDGGTTFASTQTVTSMAPGAIQAIVIKNAPTGSTFASRVAYLEAKPATFA